MRELWLRAGTDLGSAVVLEFSRDVIHKLVCPKCHAEEELFVPVGAVSYEQGRCPQDGEMRAVITVHSYSGSEPFGERRLTEFGLPPFDVFVARSENEERGYLLAGDEALVLGPLADRKVDRA